MTILPSAYLPSVAWFAGMAAAGSDCVVDLGEHYIKRSERNRTRILAAHGIMPLTAQVAHADRPRQPMCTMRLDYSKRWQHQHWGALVASYKASPFFDHYAAAFAPFFREPGRYDYLADFNMALLECLCSLLGLPVPAVSERYVEASAGDRDLRPKGALDALQTTNGPAFVAEPYIQVFSDRMDFQPNLSIVDLLFAEGPASRAVLRRCWRES